MSELDERDEDAFEEEGQQDVNDELDDVEDDDALSEEEEDAYDDESDVEEEFGDDSQVEDEEEDEGDWDEEGDEYEDADEDDDDESEEDDEDDELEDELDEDDPGEDVNPEAIGDEEEEYEDEGDDDELDDDELDDDELEDDELEDATDQVRSQPASSDHSDQPRDGSEEFASLATDLDDNALDANELGMNDPVNDELALDAEAASADAGDIDGVIESRMPASASGNSKRVSGLQFESVALPEMDGSPIGLRRAGREGSELIDAMAGRASVFGFGYEPIVHALQVSTQGYLGDGATFGEAFPDATKTSCGDVIRDFLRDTKAVSPDSMLLLPSADLAIESAIQLARRYRPDKAFRTIALVGSDHGRTGLCRTASGRPELHEGLGPMMAGFCHVPPGDLDAVRAVVDEQTACLLFSPVDLGQAARACEDDYLAGLRELCSEKGILLAVDETQLVFGSSGTPFAFSSLADIHADIVVASAGLFAGMPGGLVLASHQVTGGSTESFGHYPLLTAILETTIAELQRQGLPHAAAESAREFAVSMAEQLSGFEFVRDVQVLGMTIGIETDMDARDIVSAADSRGLRIETAGETAVRIQPPLVMTQEDRQMLLDRLVETMEIIERETAELSL